jgi:hypothetical protein
MEQKRRGLSVRQLQLNFGISQIELEEFYIYFMALRQWGYHQKKKILELILRQHCCHNFFFFGKSSHTRGCMRQNGGEGSTKETS